MYINVSYLECTGPWRNILCAGRSETYGSRVTSKCPLTCLANPIDPCPDKISIAPVLLWLSYHDKSLTIESHSAASVLCYIGDVTSVCRLPHSV
jgi:hypothetical protein